MEKRKILVTGTRGIPGFQGGIETHCEELYPRLVRLGCSVTITRRSPYVKDTLRVFKGVHLVNLYTPQRKRLEAIFHTLLSTFYARYKGYTFIHIHGIGPSLCVPLARLLGLKVVMTNHGSDYKRQKWGFFGRFILRAGELFGTLFSHRLITVSPYIAQRLKRMYGRSNFVCIPNGVKVHKKVPDEDFLKQYGLKKDSYILAVGRFVPEKGFHELVLSYSGMKNKKIKCVIAGDADHETDYSRKLKATARKNGCILTGFIQKQVLAQLYSHARLFVLPSFHEGLPFSLLEAMSYGCNVLVSDIPAHRIMHLDASSYFKTGDSEDLKAKIEYKLANPCKEKNREILSEYDWDTIARRTVEVYSTSR